MAEDKLRNIYTSFEITVFEVYASDEYKHHWLDVGANVSYMHLFLRYIHSNEISSSMTQKQNIRLCNGNPRIHHALNSSYVLFTD